MKQSNVLTASSIMKSAKEIVNQSKQHFFNTKKPLKRMKGSQFCQSEPIPSNISQEQDSMDYTIIKKLQNLDIKELHHSLAQTQQPETILQFRTKQPKKKKLQSKIFTVIDQSQLSKKSIKDLLPRLDISKPNIIHNKNKEGQRNFSENAEQQKIKQNIQSNILHMKPIKLEKTQFIPFYQSCSVQDNPKEFDLKKPTIQDFHIFKQLGQGTYSKVYKAINKKTGFLCALKIIEKDLVKQLNLEKNAIRQIKILSCISGHPNIATLYGSFIDQHRIYLILQLCTDGDVNMKIKQFQLKNTSSKQAQSRRMIQIVDIVKQTSEAIKQLHSNNIMHRDIKPQNIMITMGDNVKLSDFGWAVHNPKGNLRKTLCGTPLYLAPQFIATGQYNDLIDVWSLGVMAYELSTNQLPFQIKKIQDLVNIVKQDINFDRIKCPTFRDFVKKALIKDSLFRYSMDKLCNHQVFEKYKKPQ